MFPIQTKDAKALISSLHKIKTSPIALKRSEIKHAEFKRNNISQSSSGWKISFQHRGRVLCRRFHVFFIHFCIFFVNVLYILKVSQLVANARVSDDLISPQRRGAFFRNYGKAVNVPYLKCHFSILSRKYRHVPTFAKTRRKGAFFDW